MRKFLVPCLLTLAFALRLGAETNSVSITATSATTAPESPAAIEAAFQKLLADDNAAQAEADRWVRENEKFAAQGGGMDKEQLRLKLQTRFAPVRQAYDDFLKQHTNHVSALLAYGSLLNDLNAETEAAAQWERASQLAPTNPATWNNLGNHAASSGNLKQAFEYFEKAITLAPDVGTYRRNLGSAIVHFRTNAMAFYSLDEQAALDKGLQSLRLAQRKESDDFPLATEIAQVYYGFNPPRVDEALLAWEAAQKLALDEVERDGVRLHLARVNLQARRLTEARRQLDLIQYSGYAALKQKLADQVAQAEAVPAGTNAPAGTAKP